MSKPLTRKYRWKHPLYTFACCYPRNGTIYTEINHQGKTIRSSTGLKWHPSNKQKSLTILEQRIDVIVNPPNQSEEPEIKPKESKIVIDTIYKLIKRFKKTHVDNLSISAKHRFHQACYHFLKRDFYLKDIELIQDHIITNKQKVNLHPNTINKLLANLRQMFSDAVDDKLIERNPIIKKMLPRPVKTEKIVFTQEELDLLLEYFINQNKSEFVLLLKFIIQTGVRINEAIHVRWDDINSDSIIIHGKGDRDREFPLLPFPELNSILDELKAFQKSNKGKLFRWNSYAKLELWLRIALKELNINKAASFHSIRKFRENQLISDEDLDPYIVAELLGHTVRIQEKHYKEVLGAKRMTQIIMRRKSQ